MRRHLGTLLIAAGLLLAAWPVVTWAYGYYWQERLAHEWASTAAAPARELPGEAPWETEEEETTPPKPFVRLRIERIGLDTIVLDGVGPTALRRGPGHLPETRRPGESGNCAIAAHRDGWFRRLPELEVGDVVDVETPDCAYEYVVDEKRVVEPHRTDLLLTGEYPMLTLITCTGPRHPYSIHRLLVFCHLQAARPY